MSPEEQSASRQSIGTLWVAVGTFVLYLATAQVAARLAGQAASTAPVWSAEAVYPTWSRPILLLFGLSGVAIALLVPAAAWALVAGGGRLRVAALFHRAFALNLIQATAFVSAWKGFAGAVPPRPAFIAWQALVTAVGIVMLFRARYRNRIPPVDSGRPLLVGILVLLLLLPALLWAKTFVEDGSGDGTEAFEFSRSLAIHQLPYWDLENGYYGFYPQFMLFAYPTQLCFITIGETEAAQRLPVFFYLLGIYLVLVELVRRRRRRLAWAEISLLAGAAVFFLIYHAHHATYELVADLAEPTGVDTYFTFLATSAFYALVTRQRLWWGLFALLSSMALVAGLPFAVLFLFSRMIARRPRLRWVALRSYLLDAMAVLIPWMAYQLLVTVYSRFHPQGVTKWALENPIGEYALKVDPAVALTLTATFAVIVAVVPFVSLGFALWRDKLLRMVGLAVAGYFVLLVLFARTNPHYLIPLSLFPAAIFLRAVAAPERGPRIRTIGRLAYGALLLALTLLVLPRDRTPHTAYREFGARTLMLYDSYPAVVDAAERLLRQRPELSVYLPNGKPALPWQRAEIVFADQRPGGDRSVQHSIADLVRRRSTGSPDAIPWGLSHHLWVRYSDRTPVKGRDYHQVLAAPHWAPRQLEGFSRRDLPDGWVFFYRPERSIFASLTPAGGRSGSKE